MREEYCCFGMTGKTANLKLLRFQPLFIPQPLEASAPRTKPPRLPRNAIGEVLLKGVQCAEDAVSAFKAAAKLCAVLGSA